MRTPSYVMTDADALNQTRLETIFRTNGFDPEVNKNVTMKDAMDVQNAAFCTSIASFNKNVTMKDAMDVQNAAFLIPRVMTQMVQEGIEPLLIGTHLLQRIEIGRAH